MARVVVGGVRSRSESGGRWPLGSLFDQFSEAGVESGSARRVDLTVGSSKNGFAFWVVFDTPPVLMEEPVVVTAEQDQIAQIGGSTVGPMGLVVGMDETSFGASRPDTSPVSMPQLTS